MMSIAPTPPSNAPVSVRSHRQNNSWLIFLAVVQVLTFILLLVLALNNFRDTSFSGQPTASGEEGQDGLASFPPSATIPSCEPIVVVITPEPSKIPAELSFESYLQAIEFGTDVKVQVNSIGLEKDLELELLNSNKQPFEPRKILPIIDNSITLPTTNYLGSFYIGNNAGFEPKLFEIIPPQIELSVEPSLMIEGKYILLPGVSKIFVFSRMNWQLKSTEDVTKTIFEDDKTIKVADGFDISQTSVTIEFAFPDVKTDDGGEYQTSVQLDVLPYMPVVNLPEFKPDLGLYQFDILHDADFPQLLVENDKPSLPVITNNIGNCYIQTWVVGDVDANPDFYRVMVSGYINFESEETIDEEDNILQTDSQNLADVYNSYLYVDGANFCQLEPGLIGANGVMAFSEDKKSAEIYILGLSPKR